MTAATTIPIEKNFTRLNRETTEEFVKQFVADSDGEQLRNRLIQRIQNALEFSVENAKDKQEAIRVFARDIERLQKAKKQWTAFIEQLAKVHVEARGMTTLPDDIRVPLTNGLRNLFKEAKTLDFESENRLSAKLLKHTTEQLVAILDTSLKRMTFDLVVQVFENLEWLNKGKILGSMVWETGDACSFHDWKHSINANYSEQTSETSFVRTPIPSDGIDADWVVDAKVKKVTNGKFTHNASRTEQHLMGAESATLDPASQVIPRKFDSLIRKIPSFLRNEVNLVTGEQFLSNEQTFEFVEVDFTGTQTTKEIRVHNDPAIVLGDTVLVAWDSDDCHREQNERTADGKKITAIQQFLLAVSFLLLTATIYVSLGRFSPVSILVFSALLVVGISFAVRAFIDWAIFKRKKASLMSVFYASSGWAVLSLATCIGIEGVIYGLLMKSIVAAVATAGGISLIRSAINEIIKKP